MKTGELAPDFELSDQDGVPRKLSILLADGPVALFFYPAAMTPGCTKEACHFRDLAGEFAAAGLQRVGISADAVNKQKQFSDRHSFDYPLLSDAEGTVAALYGVKRGRLGQLLGARVSRSTFVIDTDQTILAAIHSEVSMDAHADRAIEAVIGR